MISLEQVKQLESKVIKVIDSLKKAAEEKTQLIEKLDSYQKRIDELEALVQRFKDDQSRIEDGILSALDRLNQFEDALESRLSAGSSIADGNNAVRDTIKKENPVREAKQAPRHPEAQGSQPPLSGLPQRAENNGGEEAAIPRNSPYTEEKNSENGELDIF